ncbi:MAG: HNH endonuclease signature motif containing protein [Chloroflexi bacterium]|nr:HNH endonuclease signature motif containing protein [Chloroflexota bacterium]
MIKIYIPSAIKRAVIERAHGHCEYCLSPVAWSPEIFEVEHVHPLGAGGATKLSNLAYACPACNRYKLNKLSAIDPELDQTVALFNPRLYVWREHFHWSSDLSMIIGLTPMGRATSIVLKMNRPTVQRFRLALVAIGQHPALKI